MTRRALLLLLLLCGCQRQPAPPQAQRAITVDSAGIVWYPGLPDTVMAMFPGAIQTGPFTYKVRLSELRRLFHRDTVVLHPPTRPDTLTRQEAPNEEVSPKEARAVGVVVRRTPARLVAAEDRTLAGAPSVTLDGWVLPSFIPHNLDTLTFRAPVRDKLPGSCAVDSSHFLTDSVWVWVERRYPTAPPWAPWHTAWHLVRRIRLAPGQPCTLNTARPAWHRFTARDRAGNVSCADSIYSGPR